MIRKKRGQVTLFIIIGLIILLSTFLILYIRYQMSDEDSVIQDKDPLQMYVEECILQITEDALTALGMQGGYINLSEAIPLINVPNSPFLSLSEGRLTIPYWLYQDSSGLEKSEMPALEKSYDGDYSIEWQLEQYIADQLKECVDLSIFEARGMQIAEIGTLEADVIIGEASVNVRVKYPLRIQKEELIETKEEFYSQVPVRLGRVYRLANEIRDYEMSNVFLEQNTMNLISIYSNVSEDRLPPMYGGLHFVSCSERVKWFYHDVYEDMKEVLVANTPFLHVANTNFEPIVITDSDEEHRQIRQGIYNSMTHQMSENIYPFIGVGFDHFEEMPLQLDLGSYGILEPNRFQVDLLFAQICMLEYQFGYNLKYPVLVTLTDSKSKLKNRDYMFQFPLQVVLKNNYPRVSYSLVKGSLDIPEVRTECDPEQWLSGKITINVVDKKNNGIHGADIQFQCGPSFVYEYDINDTLKSVVPFADTCFMGTTTDGVYESRFPQCIGGGILSVTADGHLSRAEIIGDTVHGVDRTLTFVLDKVQEKRVNIEKLFVKPPGSDGVVYLDDEIVECNTEDSIKPLQSYEKALVKLQKTDVENGAISTPPFAMVEGGGNISSIKIAPGTYTVDIMLIRNERYNGEMTIPKESEARDIKSMGSSEIYRYPDKDVLIPTAFTGGVHFNWTVDEETLNRGDTIVFRVFDEGIPKILEDIGGPLIHREKCSELNYRLIEPRIR